MDQFGVADPVHLDQFALARVGEIRNNFPHFVSLQLEGAQDVLVTAKDLIWGLKSTARFGKIVEKLIIAGFVG